MHLKTAEDQLRNVPSTGVEAGFWWGELLTDQRPVDAYSLIYDSPALTEDFAILGRPQVTLHVAADAPLADWFVRLSDVAPDGSVTMVTGAGINGAQRDSMANPKDLTPGALFPLSLELHLASWVFPKGHRIRIAVSNALWPMNWPTPYPLTTSLAFGRNTPSVVNSAASARFKEPCRRRSPRRNPLKNRPRFKVSAALHGPARGRCCATKSVSTAP